MNIMDFFNDDANSVWEAMSCQRLVNAHVFNKEIHFGMRFPAPSKGKNGVKLGLLFNTWFFYKANQVINDSLTRYVRILPFQKMT